MAESFDPSQASEFQMPGLSADESKNTTHFVVADQWGNIVSATQTLGNLFGSRIMPEGTGIWLNNSLAYCTYEPKGNPMDAIPGQRKLSGDCPTMIFKEDKPWIALGTPGGHTIGQTVPQMVMNLIDFEMGLQESLDAPRVSFLEPSSIGIEYEVSEEVYIELESRGHDVTRVKALGNAHALKLIYDQEGILVGFEGASDKRGKGLAISY
jgi:gamma-glutamyltranspeptidase/glutathione hydrolase